jgi:hypothetical protein
VLFSPTGGEQVERSETSKPTRKRSKLGALYKSLKKQDSTELPPDTVSAEEQAKLQLETYKTLASKHPIEFDDDPLIWWRSFKSTIPELSIMVRSYLAIQATSCASERLFSKAGFIVNKYRTSLKSDNVSMLTFLATNSD